MQNHIHRSDVKLLSRIFIIYRLHNAFLQFEDRGNDDATG